MNKDFIRAYLWDDVIRLGFRPAIQKTEKNGLDNIVRA